MEETIGRIKSGKVLRKEPIHLERPKGRLKDTSADSTKDREHGSPSTERIRVSVSTFASEVRLEFMPSGIPAVADPFQVTQG